MAQPNHTKGTKFAIGAESTWGTEASRTVTIRPISVDIEEKAKHERLQHMIGGAADSGPVQGDKYLESKRTMGTLRAFAAYDGNGLGAFLKYILGAISSTGAGPYTHTYTVSASRQVGLSAERILGDTGKSEEFYGGFVKSLELSCDPGKPMEYAVELGFKNAAARASAGSLPALATMNPILHKHAGSVDWDSSTYTISKFKLKVTAPMLEESELGSEYITEPCLTGDLEIQLDVEILYKDATVGALKTAQLAGTTGDLELAFSDGTRTMTITLHGAYLDEFATPASSPGVLRANATWKPLASSSKGGLTVEIAGSAISGGLN